MYDVIIIGSGPGGYVAAAKAGKAGLKTLVIEKDNLGGICLNRGCIPTKALLSSAQRLLEVKDATSHGIEISGEIEFDWEEIKKRKDKVVSRLNKGIEALFKQSKVEWKQGEATIVNPQQVRVGNETFQAKQLIIATGAQPLRPEIPGLKSLYEDGTAQTAIDMPLIKEIPEKLLIVGNNVYAVEYASLFSALGSSVTLLAPDARLLPYMDAELSEFMKRELTRQKIKLVFSAEISRFENKQAVYTVNEQEKNLSFDTVLISLGSTPNLSGLDGLNLTMNDKGFIETDEYMRTSVKGVYAIGDVIGKYPLAHVASAEGIVAVFDILGTARPMQYHKLPMAVYAMPEVASVGLTEEKARQQYEDIRVSKYFMSANGKALAEGDSKGFVKILSVEPYDEVVGVHIAGNKATDLIAEGVLALQLEATLHDLASAVHAHPTPSEILMEAAGSSLFDGIALE